MKSAREQLDILSAYSELGSFRAAASLRGTSHKTVRRVVERRSKPAAERPTRPKSTDPFVMLITEKIRATDGRMSAKRLLQLCRAGGYEGSARHLWASRRRGQGRLADQTSDVSALGARAG